MKKIKQKERKETEKRTMKEEEGYCRNGKFCLVVEFNFSY